MLQPIRAVSPRINPRCPQCHCFVRLDAGTCSACGFAFALASATRRAETSAAQAQGAALQSGPQGNAQYSNLQPDGKTRKIKQKQTDIDQMTLFQGVL